MRIQCNSIDDKEQRTCCHEMITSGWLMNLACLSLLCNATLHVEDFHLIFGVSDKRKMSGMMMWFWSPDFWLPPNITWDTFMEEKIISSSTVKLAKNLLRSFHNHESTSNLYFMILA